MLQTAIMRILGVLGFSVIFSVLFVRWTCPLTGRAATAGLMRRTADRDAWGRGCNDK